MTLERPMLCNSLLGVLALATFSLVLNCSSYGENFSLHREAQMASDEDEYKIEREHTLAQKHQYGVPLPRERPYNVDVPISDLGNQRVLRSNRLRARLPEDY